MSSSSALVTADLLRYAAFTDHPGGGNPAGLVLDARELDEQRMRQIAREVGYSETAFLRARPGGPRRVRHALLQSRGRGAALRSCDRCCGRSVGRATGFRRTRVPRERGAGGGEDTARSGWHVNCVAHQRPPPRIEEPSDDVAEALSALGWRPDELDQALLPRIAYAGARHLILAASSRGRLASLDYELERLKRLMLDVDLTTVDSSGASGWIYHARNPFPVGGVYEDPATGAAAAAFGGYLRALSLVVPPARVTILQGHDMGRPSLIALDIPPGDGGIVVTGAAVPIAAPTG